MNTKLLLVFIILNIANVVIQTVKSIATVKCGKLSAAIINAVAYGLYTIVTVYLMCELDLYLKAGIVALCNLVGVYAVKWFEEKARKDKLWKVEMAVPIGCNPHDIRRGLDQCGISSHDYEMGKWRIFHCYCERQSQTRAVKAICESCQGKISAYESKTL